MTADVRANVRARYPRYLCSPCATENIKGYYLNSRKVCFLRQRGGSPSGFFPKVVAILHRLVAKARWWKYSRANTLPHNRCQKHFRSVDQCGTRGHKRGAATPQQSHAKLLLDFNWKTIILVKWPWLPLRLVCHRDGELRFSFPRAVTRRKYHRTRGRFTLFVFLLLFLLLLFLLLLFFFSIFLILTFDYSNGSCKPEAKILDDWRSIQYYLYNLYDHYEVLNYLKKTLYLLLSITVKFYFVFCVFILYLT